MPDTTPAAKHPPPLSLNQQLPASATPLPSARLNPLQRIIAPLGLSLGSRTPDDHSRHRDDSHSHSQSDHSSQTAQYRTGIPIAALDINAQKTHAVLAGKEILTTIRIQDGKVKEDFNLRSSITTYASKQSTPQAETSGKRRDFLPARDVRWSTGIYDHIVATAATNGRISLYDVKAGGPRIELAWLYQHTGQVTKLDFDSFAGYLLLSASQDKSVRLWDIRDPKHVLPKNRFDVRNGVRDVRWSNADGFEFAACADGGVIQLWDIRHAAGPKLNINAHEKACYSIDWHPDGRHVVSGGFDKLVKVWDFHSDNRRQKPALSFRTPQAIRTVRWRPPCYSSELAETGGFQCTQLATSYHLDDPRIHVWDLRRPQLPFREIDRFGSCATDLLWADKNFLWTVGEEGIFTQNDVSFAPQVQNQIAPCALDWMPDGQCAMFFEERGYRRAPGLDDSAVGFLNLPLERLSAGDEGEFSRSLTDDEDSNLDGMPSSTGSFRRRQGRVASARSTKSQANTPPTADDRPRVLPLDRTVLHRLDLFNNDQTGVIGNIPGLAEESEVVQYLANNFAPIATEAERKATPQMILQRLETCFSQNAKACDNASLNRMAQSWRILGAVIVPELRDWADKNRSMRKAEAQKRKEKRKATQPSRNGYINSPVTKLADRTFDWKVDVRPQRGMSNLFKGIVDAERGVRGAEFENSSNMTTPLAKPLPDSPFTRHRDFSSPLAGEGIDNIQPLPPSLLGSHATAAAASQAVRDDSSADSNSTPSSPEKYRHATSSSKNHAQREGTSSSQRTHKRSSSSLSQRPQSSQAHKQEERRAALKDYRAQARPIFTLQEPPKSPVYGQDERDSTESFMMFSASTDSSHKALSLGNSLGSPNAKSKSSDEIEWQSRKNKDKLSIESPSWDERPKSENDLTNPRTRHREPSTDILSNFGMDGATDLSFGHDVSPGSGEHNHANLETRQDIVWNTHQLGVVSAPIHDITVSSSPEVFHFEAAYSPPRTQIHPTNPVLASRSTVVSQAQATQLPVRVLKLADDELDTDEYHFTDFRPVDLSKYESRLPFAWSAVPLICQCVAFDLDNGIAHAQFATHLLMHVSPYFFHKDYRNTTAPDSLQPTTIADRLLRPDLSARVIEAIFLQHTSYLKRMHFWASMAELRQICDELDYPKVISFASQAAKGSSLTANDVNLVAHTCSHCKFLTQQIQTVCENCQKLRSPCPICLSLTQDFNNKTNSQADYSAVDQAWSFCQACSHSAHARCMEEWLSHPFSEGACPTSGCDCDCGSGLVRQRRILNQIKSVEENRLIRGLSQSAARKDSLRVSPSPAVDKTRAVLRESRGDRVSQSDTERESSSLRNSISRVEPGWQRKSVRLVTPGEESSRRTSDARKPRFT